MFDSLETSIEHNTSQSGRIQKYYRENFVLDICYSTSTYRYSRILYVIDRYEKSSRLMDITFSCITGQFPDSIVVIITI